MKPSEILKAHEDGLKMEWKYDGEDENGWTPLLIDEYTRIHSLQFPNTKYRIKKEPRTFWVILRNNGEVISSKPDEENANRVLSSLNSAQYVSRYQPYSVIKVTENL